MRGSFPFTVMSTWLLLCVTPRHRLVESCFGPVCRGPGSRRLKPDFAPKMKDWDGRPIEVLALYHDKYQDPQLTPLTDDVAFNFMELVFDVTATNPAVEFKIRRLEDRPSHSPHGGGPVKVKLKETGQEPSSFCQTFGPSKELTSGLLIPIGCLFGPVDPTPKVRPKVLDSQGCTRAPRFWSPR